MEQLNFFDKWQGKAEGKTEWRFGEGEVCEPVSLVLPRSAWNDTLPDWIRVRVALERSILKSQGKQEATDAEALAYLYPLSLESPLDHDWTTIYLYLATTTFEKMGKEVPEDIKTETLSPYLQGQLDRLKSDIFQKTQKFFHKQLSSRQRKGGKRNGL